MLIVRLSSLKEQMAKSGVPQHLILKHIAPDCPRNAAAVKKPQRLIITLVTLQAIAYDARIIESTWC